jgi:glycolate oxidase FAD binding subunit
MQQILEQFQAQVRAAAPANAAAHPRRRHQGLVRPGARVGEILDTRAYAGIVDYEPTELVITARCGTPLAEIEAVLASASRCWPSSRRISAMARPRRHAIAAACPARAAPAAARCATSCWAPKLMDGKGEVLNFGGQVMKNVAGYDVSRLLAGSMGTLGLLLEVSVKVLPLAYREATLRFEMTRSTRSAS